MNKKQLMIIIAIIVVGTLIGAFVLLKGSNDSVEMKASARQEESHADGKEHVDTEHHGGKSDQEHKEAKGHVDPEHHATSEKKGPRGGQLFSQGDFDLEVVLAEDAGEARFMVYPGSQGKPVPPTSAKVSAILTRPDGEAQEIAFSPDGEALKSTTAIAEPHVFDAKFSAQTGKEAFVFLFSKEEGKVELSDAQIKASGVTMQTAGAARIQSALQLPGEIGFNEDRTAHVVPRVAGVVEAVSANLGQTVKKGAVLAIISSTSLSEQRSDLLAAQKRLEFARTTYSREKKLWEEKISAQQDYLQAQQQLREAEIAAQNAQQKLAALGATAMGANSLSRFEVRAPFDGAIVEKHITLGETVKEEANIFVMSDLSTVWANIVVPAKDVEKVRVGTTAIVTTTSSETKSSGKVSYVGALIGEQTRSANARVVLQNPQMAWRPGLYVNVELVAEQSEVPVAVSTDAIQTINDKPVIFMRVKDGFVAQPVTLGRSNGKQIEIVNGLKSGASYAASGSFVIKAELGKGSAEHAH